MTLTKTICLLILCLILFCSCKQQHQNMNKDTFWEIIETAKEKAGPDTDKRHEVITALLLQYSPKDISIFRTIAGSYVNAAEDNLAVWGACKIIEGYASDDTFLYFCCWLVSQGREIYTQAVKNPDSLATEDTEYCANTGDGCIFEMLLYCPYQAYQLKTGKEPDMNASALSNKEMEQLQSDLFEGMEFMDDTPFRGSEIEAKWRLPEILPNLSAMFCYDANAQVKEAVDMMRGIKDPKIAKARLEEIRKNMERLGIDPHDFDL